jgi:hypothetical protein
MEPLTLRLEIRMIVDQAKAAGKPISGSLIWGLIKRDVPENGFSAVLSSMCASHQITRVPAPDTMDVRQGTPCYEPGPVGVNESKHRDRFSRAIGFMARRRLVEARAAAKRWKAA